MNVKPRRMITKSGSIRLNLKARKRVFEKSFSVDFTTPTPDKRLPENKGFGVCDRPAELHLRLNLTLFKHLLSRAF